MLTDVAAQGEKDRVLERSLEVEAVTLEENLRLHGQGPRGLTRTNLVNLAVMTWITVVVGCWLLYVVATIQTRGVFSWLGGDFTAFCAGGRAFLTTGPASVFSLQRVITEAQPFTSYFGLHEPPFQTPAGLYPPVFYLLIAPFTLLPPLASFITWTASQVALALWIIGTLARRFPQHRGLVVATTMLFFPLSMDLFYGQIAVLLMFALYKAYRALEDGADFRAGVWCGLILIKPQYGIVLPLVLLYKRRWRAVAGLAAVGAFLAISSAILLGPSGIRSYLDLSHSYSGFRVVQSTVHPEVMISWRGVLVNFLPPVPEAVGEIATLALSAATVALLLIVWCGPWDARGPRFPMQMLASVIIMLLAAYHSHDHGATLLIVPALALAARDDQSTLVQGLLRAGLFVVPCYYFGTFFASGVTVAHIWSDLLIVGIMLGLLATILWHTCRVPERYQRNTYRHKAEDWRTT